MVISLQLFGIDVLNFYIGPPPQMEQAIIQNTGGNFERLPEEVEYVYEEEEESRARFGFSSRA